MKKLDTYLNLCTDVYDLSKPKPPIDAYEFYRAYMKKTIGPILEPMCGSGRFLLPLLEEGFDIQGFDASEDMLKALYTKAKAKQLSPNVWEGYVENLNRSERYGLIFIPTGSFGLIVDLVAAKAALKIFYDHLQEGGILLFEGETLNAVPKELGIWRGSVWHKSDSKMILLSQLARLEGNVCESIAKYELVDSNQIMQTEIEMYKIRLYDPATLTNMLEEVGFKSIKMIKAFDRMNAPDEKDEVIIYECRKS